MMEMRTVTPKRGIERERNYIEQLWMGGAEGPQTMGINIVVCVDDTTTHLIVHA